MTTSAASDAATNGSAPAAPASSPGADGPVVIAIDGGPQDPVGDVATHFTAGLNKGFPGRALELFFTQRNAGGINLVTETDMRAGNAPGPGSPPSGTIQAGGIPGDQSALPALLRRADEMKASAVVLLAGDPHDVNVDWVRLMVEPIVFGGYDYVCPTYLRQKLDGFFLTGIAYPFTRALYGHRLRQPLGGEVAISIKLARQLLGSDDWALDPIAAGADTWLTAQALSGNVKVAQAYLGARARRPAEGGDPSPTLARVLGLLFREMERHASLWQRVRGSQPVPTLGTPGFLPDEGTVIDTKALLNSFQLGLTNLETIWGLFLPPATLIGLRRALARAGEGFKLDDTLWARIVYDFAVAHFTKALERTQLLHSFTPLYLAWVASFVTSTQQLEPPAVEDRVEALAMAFEKEKQYLIGRWRWPDRFSP